MEKGSCRSSSDGLRCALAAPASAQLAGARPDAANHLDYARPFVTEAVIAGISVLWLQWEEERAQTAQLCLDGRVVEQPDYGRVALIEAVTPVESTDACRGKWTLGGLAFLPAGEHSDEEIGELACQMLSTRPDWYLFGFTSGRELGSSSLWCANLRPGEATTLNGPGSN